MIRPFVADLHVHSVLSPCAEVEMTPRHIVLNALSYGVDILAITDHNSSENVEAALSAAQGTGVVVIPGMEVETKEEIHLIVLFETLEQLSLWQEYINKYLPPRKNDEKRFGAQFVVDKEDNLLYVKEQMLLLPVMLGISEITKKVKDIGGVCIASHVDRPSYSILSQLGFIPSDIHLDAVEIARYSSMESLMNRFSSITSYPVITSSDAHNIMNFCLGVKTIFYMERPVLSEIKQAIYGKNGRRVVCNYYLPKAT